MMALKAKPSTLKEALPVQPAAPIRPAASPAMPKAVALNEQTLAGIWEKLSDECGMVMGNHLRRLGLPAIYGPNALAVVVPRDYNAAYQYLTDEGQVPRLETILRRLTGETWRLRVEKGDTASGVVPIVAPPAARKEYLDSPIFKLLIDKGGASILKADQNFGLPPEKPGPSRRTGVTPRCSRKWVR